MTDDRKPLTYADAGVDLIAGAQAVAKYRESAESTAIAGVLGAIGGFGGLFSLRDAGFGALDDPVLVAATDGVGTKLKLAFACERHDTIGQDCVAMCVNDIAAVGAQPLFFLDYLATGVLDPQQAAEVVAGVADACRVCGCALLGGETAEMPGFYNAGEYDVAGFCVGIGERSELFSPDSVRAGDLLVGLRSSGFHSNGYSLIRKIIDASGASLDDPFEDSTLGAALLEPTMLYPAALRAVRNAGIAPRSAAHITGGGFYENIPRALNAQVGAVVDPTSWVVPRIIEHVVEVGAIESRERYSVFNMGIGMVLIYAPSRAPDALSVLQDAGFGASIIGEVTASPVVKIAGVD